MAFPGASYFQPFRETDRSAFELEYGPKDDRRRIEMIETRNEDGRWRDGWNFVISKLGKEGPPLMFHMSEKDIYALQAVFGAFHLRHPYDQS